MIFFFVSFFIYFIVISATYYFVDVFDSLEFVVCHGVFSFLVFAFP